MTTVAMGAGMLPIALKIGADADFRAPMAIAVIGGLVTSTILSLFYVPVVFTYVDDAKRWIGRVVGKFGKQEPATSMCQAMSKRSTEESPTLATKNVLIPLVNTGGAVAQIHDS
jgi:hypothetical protein